MTDTLSSLTEDPAEQEVHRSKRMVSLQDAARLEVLPISITKINLHYPHPWCPRVFIIMP